MDSTSDTSCSHGKHGDIGSATAHLKASWAQAKNAAQDVDEYVESRPKTIALGALGAGLLLGLVTGILIGMARSARHSSSDAA